MSTAPTIRELASEIRHVSGECKGRHDRTNGALTRVRDTVVEHDRRLVGLCGDNGMIGAVGRMQADIAENSKRSEMNEKAVATLRHERRAQLTWSASGAGLGAGGLIGMLELLRHLFGG